MSRYPLGAPIRLSTEVRDIAGVLANAGALTLTLLKPDGTTLPPYSSPTNDSTGKYHQDVPAADLTLAGHWQYKWVSTGANAGVSSGSFDVYDPFDSELLSLDDAKQHLNIPAATTTYDAELEVYVAATTGSVEGIIGPVGRRTVTETVYPSSGVLLLSTTPVLSLTSVTPYAGTALTVGSLVLSPNSGVVYPGTYGSFWASSYVVVYTVGRASVPAEVNLAARIILAHLWETQRGPAELPLAAPDEGGLVAGFGFAIPNRAKELLAAYRLAPAVA